MLRFNRDHYRKLNSEHATFRDMKLKDKVGMSFVVPNSDVPGHFVPLQFTMELHEEQLIRTMHLRKINATSLMKGVVVDIASFWIARPPNDPPIGMWVTDAIRQHFNEKATLFMRKVGETVFIIVRSDDSKNPRYTCIEDVPWQELEPFFDANPL